jgi:hypothetical protein
VSDIWWASLRWGKFGLEDLCLSLPALGSPYALASRSRIWCHSAKDLPHPSPKITYFKILSRLSPVSIQFTIEPKLCAKEHGGWVTAQRETEIEV